MLDVNRRGERESTKGKKEEDEYQISRGADEETRVRTVVSRACEAPARSLFRPSQKKREDSFRGTPVKAPSDAEKG